jgi:hypothetical protein
MSSQSEIVCHAIIQSGKNKGKECGRVNCHFHNTIETLDIIITTNDWRKNECWVLIP